VQKRWKTLGALHVVGALLLACVGNDPDAAALPDAGADGSVSPSDAGGVEGSTAAPTDADADAGNVLPEAGASFCAGEQAAFCADFDAVGSAGESWTSTSDNGGTVSLSGNDFVSPPQSALFSLEATSQGQRATVTKTIQTQGKRHVVVKYKWKLRPYTLASGQSSIVFMEMRENGTSPITMIHGLSQGWFVDINRTDAAGLQKPANNQWIDVVVDVVFSSQANGSVIVSFDGIVVASKSSVKTSSESESATVSLEMGPTAHDQGGSPKVEQLVDDLVVELP
jgi:hypothetical protein